MKTAIGGGATIAGAVILLWNFRPIDEPVKYLDLSYGPEEHQVVDLHVSHLGEAPMPLMIWAHGGWAPGGSIDEIVEGDYLWPYIEAGWAVASINFADPSVSPFPAPGNDGARAVQYFRNHADRFGINAMRIGFHGRSAGAAVGMRAAYGPEKQDLQAEDEVLHHSSRPDLMIDQSGCADFRDLPGSNTTAAEYFGVATMAQANPTHVKKASAVWMLDRDFLPFTPPPTYIFHATGSMAACSPPTCDDVHNVWFGQQLDDALDEWQPVHYLSWTPGVDPDTTNMVQWVETELGW